MGLIGDGSYCGEPANEFNYIRKNYYSYKILAENIDTDKALFVENNSFHNELSGDYGYIYQDLNTTDNFEILWTDNSSSTYDIILTDDYELTNMVPSDTLGNFATQTLAAGTHSLTIYNNEVYLLKKSNVLSVNEDINNHYSVFPNPTNGIFTIDNVQSFENIIIYNSLGHAVYKNILSINKKTIDLSKQLSGIYFIHLQSTNKGTTVIKLMKNK